MASSGNELRRQRWANMMQFPVAGVGENGMKIAHRGWTILLAGLCAAALGVFAPGAAASARRSAQSSGTTQVAQSAPAQNGHTQADPLAAAARRAREKQTSETKPAKVWDNDNLPAADGVNVIGPSATSSSPQAAAGSAEGNAPGATASGEESSTASDRSELESQLKSAKADLKQLQTQLDFARRKFALDQQSFYQNPNYGSDDAGAQALKNEQSQIDSQKQQVDAAQKKVDELTSKLKAAGGTSSGSQGAGGQNSGGQSASSGAGAGKSNAGSSQ